MKEYAESGNKKYENYEEEERAAEILDSIDLQNVIIEPRFSWPRPAVIRVGNISCHQGRAFPIPGDHSNRYLVSQQYWRLLSYIQGFWPILARFERIPHVAVTGISGCGKSWSFAAAASFLRQRRLYNAYRVLSIADCRCWLESSDPLSFFSMEMMVTLRGDSGSELNLVKSRLVIQQEELRPWLNLIDEWLMKSNIKLVIFLDQVEALLGKPDVVPNVVIQALMEMSQTLIVMSLTVDGPSERTAIANWGFSRLGFYQMRFPFHIPNSDYTFLPDLLFNTPISFHETSLFREVRLYTGGIMRELVACLTFGKMAGVFTMSGVDLTPRLDGYRLSVLEKIEKRVEETVGRLDRVQRVAFLLVIFRMILRLPADAATSSINLPAELRSLFLPAVAQRFYHPRDAIAVVLHIPTAISHSVFLGLSTIRLLHLLADKPLQVMHKLIASIMDAKTVCGESKRRMIRFYTHFRITSGLAMHISGITDFDRHIEFDIPKHRLVHHFAGFAPSKDLIAWLLAQAIIVGDAQSELKNVSSALKDEFLSTDLGDRAIPIVLIPGRTDYCFFDFFLFNPCQRKLFAISTAAGPADWQKNASNRFSQSPPCRDTILTPSSLIDMWARVLKEVNPSKFTIHCVYVKPLMMLKIADCPWTAQLECPGEGLE